MTNLLDTNLNQAPYYDDYNANAEYYRVLFKPSVAVQTRELNQIQSMVQRQFDVLGGSIYVNGTIIQGCKVTYSSNYNYVKILDNYANGFALNISSLNGYYLLSNTGLKAQIINYIPGYVAASPNLNTLYVAYLNSAPTNTQIKVFQNDEVLSVVTSANLLLGQVTVANAISSGSSNTTGSGYAVNVDQGIIFQKGMSLLVNPQTLIVTPYTNAPDGLSVGFYSTENVVTAYQDPTLYDNAQGASNQFAPGADRLQIIPQLVAVQTNTINSNTTPGNSFFSIVSFIQGAPSVVQQTPVYSIIGKKMAEISADTNGSFIINPFLIKGNKLYFANGSLDANNIRLEIDGGLGYINGTKVGVAGKLISSMRKGLDIGYANTQILTTHYGNYLVCDDVGGNFDPTNLQTVQLRSANAYSVSNNLAKGTNINSIAPPGSQIGTATLIGMRQNTLIGGTPTGTYNLYLTNIQMIGTNQFASVRSIFANNSGTLGFADVIPINNTAVLQNPFASQLVYQFNQGSMKTLKTAANTIDTQFNYRTATSVSFTTSGNCSVVIPTYVGGTNQLPYGVGSLSLTALTDFILVSEGTANTTNLAGVSSVTTGTNTVNGTTTLYTSALYPGALITLANSTVTETKMVATVVNTTQFTTTLNWTNTWTNANAYVTYLPGTNIPLSSMNANVYIINATAFSINLNQTLNATMAANVYYNILRTAATGAKKQLQTQAWIKIDCSNNNGNTVGPWCLGIPDGYTLGAVYVGTTYANTNPNLVSQFTLINGQSDIAYGLSYLQSNGAVLTGTSKLLVQLEAYLKDSSSGAGFYSVDSYPVDDTGATANSIYTQDIPWYNSLVLNEQVDLRDAVDFRLYVQNTIPYIANVTNAIANTLIINPANTVAYTTTNLMMPVPDAQFQSSLQYYMGRYDRIGITNTASILIQAGSASPNPVPPAMVANSRGLELALAYIPPYPSVTMDVVDPNMATNYPRVNFQLEDHRRYTMSDISSLDQRLQNVEYYTSLSLLEQSVQNLQLTTTSGQNRFKNGFFADPMDDFSIANTLDPTFNIAIDSELSVARPLVSQTLIPLILNPNYANGSFNVETTNTWIGAYYANNYQSRLVTLPYTVNTSPIISQPFATQQRNPVQYSIYKWTGTLAITPDGDYHPDTGVNPSIAANTSSISNWINLNNAWQTQYGSWKENAANGSFTNAVTSVSLLPFCRANLIKFVAYGLKPTTQFWFYVDDTNVTQKALKTGNTWVINSTSSNVLTTDANGTIYGLLYLPANTFHSGTLNFQMIDVNNLVTQAQTITSQATTLYYGTNLAYTMNAIRVSITNITQTINNINNTYNSTSYNSYNNTNAGTNNQNTGGNYYKGGNQPQDPIAQSFNINDANVPIGTPGVYLHSMNLYFGKVDPLAGVTIEFREMTNGYPSANLIPYGKIHIPAGYAKVGTVGSGTASAPLATRIYFTEPLYFNVDTDYCFVVKPDGGSPNFTVWTGVISSKDAFSQKACYSLPGGGQMFLSIQDTTWTAYQSESIKYDLFYETFSPTSGTIPLQNADMDFWSISNTGNTFVLGENVYIGNVIFANANATVNVSSNKVTLASTTGLAGGSTLLISSVTNQAGQIGVVNTVTNSTQVVLNSNINFTDTQATVYSSYMMNGLVYSTNGTNIFVINAAANSTTYAVNGSTYNMMGANSGAWAYGTLNDVPYDAYMPKFYFQQPPMTIENFNFRGTSNATAGYVNDTTYTALTSGIQTELYDNQRVVMSKSNEMHYSSGTKSLLCNVSITSFSNSVTPALDMIKAGALLIHNLINSESGNTVYNSEKANRGLANNRYVSTTVVLSPSLSAEDLVVYAGVYLPPNTQIYVYGKVQSQYDPDVFNNKAWTPMYTLNTTRSSKVNPQDVQEYIYYMPNTVPTDSTAYLDSTNNGVLTYTSQGVKYATYNTFAIKFVLLADSSQNVPMLLDLRAISTTANV